MTARDTYIATVATAVAAAVASTVKNTTSAQTTADAGNTITGYNLQTGSYASFLSALKSGIAAAQANALAVEQAKQAAIMLARDALRTAGDLGPV